MSVRHRGGDLVVAERLDHGAAEVIDAARRVADQHRRRPWDRCAIAASARTSAGRTNSPSSFSSAASSLGVSAGRGLLLEVAVGDLAQPIVRRGQRRVHRVGGARIVEAGQQDRGPEADVAVGVLADRLQQRRHRLRRGRAANRAAGRHARRVVEVAELVDRRRGSARATSASGRAPARTPADNDE